MNDGGVFLLTRMTASVDPFLCCTCSTGIPAWQVRQRMRVTVNGLIDGVSVGDQSPHLSSSGKSKKPDLSRVEIPFLRVAVSISSPVAHLAEAFSTVVHWCCREVAVVEDKTGTPVGKATQLLRTFQIRYHLTETTSGQNQTAAPFAFPVAG